MRGRQIVEAVVICPGSARRRWPYVPFVVLLLLPRRAFPPSSTSSPAPPPRAFSSYSSCKYAASTVNLPVAAPCGLRVVALTFTAIVAFALSSLATVLSSSTTPSWASLVPTLHAECGPVCRRCRIAAEDPPRPRP